VPERFKTPKKRRNSEIAEEEREIAGAAIFHASFRTVLTQFWPVDPFRPGTLKLTRFHFKEEPFFFDRVLPTWEITVVITIECTIILIENHLLPKE
jgi:hypothetical protein